MATQSPLSPFRTSPHIPRTPASPAWVALSWLPGALFFLLGGRPDHWCVHPRTRGAAQGWLSVWEGCAWNPILQAGTFTNMNMRRSQGRDKKGTGCSLGLFLPMLIMQSSEASKHSKSKPCLPGCYKDIFVKVAKKNVFCLTYLIYFISLIYNA